MSERLGCSHLSVERDGRHLLDDVSLTVAANEWVCVLGPNGAGKTTLLRALSGALRPASGEIRTMGSSFAEMRARDRARTVAIVPQTPIIPPGMRVLDYVLLGRTPHHGIFGSIGRSDVEATDAALDSLELREFATRAVDSLSGGERQRVVIARALAQEAPVLLLDEPTTSLDIGHQQDVLDLVDRLRHERDLGVLSAMHDLTLAGQYADRLVLLRDGRVVHAGDPHEVMTPENLARHFGARVTVVDGPYGRIVVPVRER